MYGNNPDNDDMRLIEKEADGNKNRLGQLCDKCCYIVCQSIKQLSVDVSLQCITFVSYFHCLFTPQLSFLSMRLCPAAVSSENVVLFMLIRHKQ